MRCKLLPHVVQEREAIPVCYPVVPMLSCIFPTLHLLLLKLLLIKGWPRDVASSTRNACKWRFSFYAFEDFSYWTLGPTPHCLLLAEQLRVFALSCRTKADTALMGLEKRAADLRSCG
jgi:hypothetical protein